MRNITNLSHPLTSKKCIINTSMDFKLESQQMNNNMYIYSYLQSLKIKKI